jgi:hypothetical protein
VEFVSGNVFIREMRFEKAGEMIQGHTHNFDHTTYVARGALRIEALRVGKAAIGDTPPEYEVVKTAVKRAGEGHNWVLIKADVCHRITALEDHSMGHCIYAHHTPQGTVQQQYDGWDAAYV